MGFPAGDYLNVRLGGAVPFDTWSIGFWYHVTGQSTVPTPSQMDGAANAALAGFNTIVWSDPTSPLKAKVNAATNLSTCKVYYYRDGVLVAGGSNTITAVPGTGASGAPSYIARCVTVLTQTPGKSHRGRFYLPWNGEVLTGNTENWPSAQGILDRLAFRQNSSTGTQSTGFFFGGSEQADYGVMSQTHALFTSATSYRMNSKPDTQRGRQDKAPTNLVETSSIS